MFNVDYSPLKSTSWAVCSKEMVMEKTQCISLLICQFSVSSFPTRNHNSMNNVVIVVSSSKTVVSTKVTRMLTCYFSFMHCIVFVFHYSHCAAIERIKLVCN